MRYQTIDVSADLRWDAPVWVRVGNGMPEAVRGPQEALDRLSYRWPATRGRHYLDAKAICTAALRKRIASEKGRIAFIRAAIEADMLDGSG